MKDKLLHAIDEGREREAELERLVVDGPAHADGRWAAKDHLAHVSWWRRRTAETLDAARTGVAPPARLDDDDEQNALVYAQVKDLSASDVRRDAHESWTALRAAVETSSEEDLAMPHPRRPEAAVWEAVAGSVGHTGTHVWTAQLEAGDVDGGLEVGKWAAELEGRFFTTPEQLADSRYNLACVYARLGKADQALPLLRESLKAKPEVAEWARKDHDLDGIRDEPEFKELLAT